MYSRFCKHALAELDACGICASVRLVRRVRDHMVDHVPSYVMFQIFDINLTKVPI